MKKRVERSVTHTKGYGLEEEKGGGKRWRGGIGMGGEPEKITKKKGTTKTVKMTGREQSDRKRQLGSAKTSLKKYFHGNVDGK